MMWIVGAIFLIMLFSMVFTIRKTGNIFHPISFFLFFQILEYFLPLLMNDPAYYVKYTDENVLVFIIYESLFIACVVLGFYCFDKKKRSRMMDESRRRTALLIHESKVSYTLIFVLYIAGLFSRVLLIMKMGGFLYVYHNPHASYSSMISGFGIYSIFARLMLISIFLMFEKLLCNFKKIDLAIFLIMSFTYIFSYLIYSSRGPALELIIAILCAYSFNKKKIGLSSLIKPIILIPLFLVVILAAVTYLRRTSSSADSNLLVSFVGIFTKEFNRVDRDMFVYSYFGSNEKWNGLSYLNVLYMYIPSSIFPNKPATDDGLYLMNLIDGFKVNPSMGINDIKSDIGSVPFTSQGTAFANFGVLGIVLVGFLTGLIYKHWYYKVRESNNCLTSLLYFYIIYIFGFTTLFLQNIILLFVLGFVVNLYIKSRKHYRIIFHNKSLQKFLK